MKRLASLILFLVLLLDVLPVFAGETENGWTVTQETILESQGGGGSSGGGSSGGSGSSGGGSSNKKKDAQDKDDESTGTKIRFGIKKKSDDLLSTAGKTELQIYMDQMKGWQETIGDFDWHDSLSSFNLREADIIYRIESARDEAEKAYWTLRLMKEERLYFGELPTEEEFYARQELFYAEASAEELDTVALVTTLADTLPSRAMTADELSSLDNALGEIIYTEVIDDRYYCVIIDDGSWSDEWYDWYLFKKIDEFHQDVAWYIANGYSSGGNVYGGTYGLSFDNDEERASYDSMSAALENQFLSAAQNPPDYLFTGSSLDPETLAELLGESVPEPEATPTPDPASYPTPRPDVEVPSYTAVNAQLITSNRMNRDFRTLGTGDVVMEGDTLVQLREGIEKPYISIWVPNELYYLTIPSADGTLRHIGDHALDNYDITYTYFKVPDSVETIGASAFTSQHMSYVLLPDSLTSLATGTFTDCDNLQGLEIPEGVTALNSGVLTDCDNLRFMVIPPTVESIDDGFIAHGSSDRVTQVVIYGYPGTAAEDYARRNGLHFVSIAPEDPATPAPTPAGTDLPTPEISVTPDPSASPTVTPTVTPVPIVLMLGITDTTLHASEGEVHITVKNGTLDAYLDGAESPAAENVVLTLSCDAECCELSTTTVSVGSLAFAEGRTVQITVRCTKWNTLFAGEEHTHTLTATASADNAASVTDTGIIDAKKPYADFLVPELEEALDEIEDELPSNEHQTSAITKSITNYVPYKREERSLIIDAQKVLSYIMENTVIGDRDDINSTMEVTRYKNHTPYIYLNEDSTPRTIIHEYGHASDYLWGDHSGEDKPYDCEGNQSYLITVYNLDEKIVQETTDYLRRLAVDEYWKKCESMEIDPYDSSWWNPEETMTPEQVDASLERIADYWITGQNDLTDAEMFLAAQLENQYVRNTTSGVGDIVDGLTNGRISGQRVHEDGYYLNDDGTSTSNAGKEAYAHYFAAVLTNDVDTLAEFRNAYPESCAVMDEAISKMASDLATYGKPQP